MNKILAQNAVYSILYRILNVIFPLVTAVYIARVLEPAGIGKVGHAQNIVSYFLMFAALGIPAYGTREIARRQRNPLAISKLFSELFVLNAISTCICFVAYFILIPLLFPGHVLLYLICSLDLLFNFINIDWFFQGKEEYRYITVRSILVKLLSLVCLVVFVKGREDYLIYATIHCLGVGLNHLFNVFYARSFVKFSFRSLELGCHLRPVLILLISTATASLYNKLDVTMLGWMASADEVGYYINAHKIVMIVISLAMAISAVFLPRLSYLFQNDKDQYNALLSKGLKAVLLLALPACVGLCLVAPDLVIVFFGELFAPAILTVQILSVLVIVKSAGDLLCYQAIISTGNERYLLRSRIWASVANVILNSLMIPYFGHNGAAVASVVSELIVNGIMLAYSLSIVKPKIEYNFISSTLISTAVMAIVVVAVQRFALTGIITLMLSVVLGVLAYFGAALLTKNNVMIYMMAILRKNNI